MSKSSSQINEVRAVVADSSDTFSIGRIFCVGRNYAAHAREMGADPEREPPFFFTKWAESYVPSGTKITYPPMTKDFHYEAELVIAMSSGGRSVAAADAEKHIFGYAVGLDMTRRDLQLAARDKGRPWDTGKNFEQSMPLAAIHKVADVGYLKEGRIFLEVNGVVKQDANLKDLIWNVGEIVQHLSQFYELRAGDIIMTGTPAGVGAVKPGDKIAVHIAGLTSLSVEVAAPR